MKKRKAAEYKKTLRVFHSNNDPEYSGYSIEIQKHTLNTKITRNYIWSWCTAYVIVPEGHPVRHMITGDLWQLSVHGGVTWNRGGWVGFDTNHGFETEHHNSLEYLKRQCQILAEQLKWMEEHNGEIRSQV